MDRIERALALLEQQNLDALFISSHYSVRYLSGFSGDTAYLYLSKNRQVLLTDSRYTTWARTESHGFEIIEVSRECNYGNWLAKYCAKEQVEHLGFEDRTMIYADVCAFAKMVPQVEWIGVGNRLDALRVIKNEQELNCIRQAAAIADHAFSHIVEILRPGMSELEVALELEVDMKKEGAEGLSFDTIAASGPHSAMPHAMPGKRQLQEGDFLTMDFGCRYEGYCSDMTRTVVIGQADERQRKVYETVWKAQKAALDMIRAGVMCCAVDAAARNLISQEGYGAFFGHGLGHSVGLFIHEEPRFSPSDQTVIQENMIETVEPGIYIPDFGGVRIEDLIVIKENGYENLTHSEKNLIEIC